MQAVILSIDTCKQDIISVGNKNKKITVKYKWNHCNNMHIISLLGGNHCLPLFNVAKRFIFLNETKQRINEFKIGYMINTDLNINKALIEQVEKLMKTKFGAITQSFIRATFVKK